MTADTSADTAADIVAALDATEPGLQNDATDTTGPDDQQPGNPDDEHVEGEESLGDAGKQALNRMKDRWRRERDARLEAEARLNDQAPADDPDRIRREARAEATREANARILSAEVRAAATGKLADPADALAFIDLEQFDVGDDGSVEQDDIAAAIDDLLATKPHLAAQGGRKSPKPDPSQGAAGRGAASTADQFAQAIGGFI